MLKVLKKVVCYIIITGLLICFLIAHIHMRKKLNNYLEYSMYKVNMLQITVYRHNFIII